MSSAPTNHFLDWLKGQLVGYAEMNELGEVTLDTIGALTDILFGAPSMQAADNPLTCVPFGGNSVTVGGVGQQFVLGRRIVNELAATNLSFATNASGSDRTDLIVGQPTEVDGYAFTTTVRNPDRTINPAATAYKKVQTANLEVIQGPGATVPSGWYQIATVVVPAGGAPIEPSNVTITLPTIGSILASLSVTSFNGDTGAITLENLDGSVTIAPAGAGVFIISAAAAAASVSTLNGLSGAIILRCLDGSIGVAVAGQFINLTNNGVRSISSPDNSVLVGGGDGVVTLTSTTMWVYNVSTATWTQVNGKLFVGGPVIAGSTPPGSTVVNTNGQTTITIPAGYTIASASAILQDASIANSVVFAVQSVSNPGGGAGSSVVFHARYTNGSSPIPAPGVGFYFIIHAF